MIYVGLLCFGLFIGSLLCVGLLFIADMPSWQKAVAFIIAAAISGAMFKFIDVLQTGNQPEARAAYPIGLFVALLWSLNGYAAVNIRSDAKRDQFFGWLQIIGLVVATALLVTYVVLQAPMESLGTRIVFGVGLAVTFSVIGLLMFYAVATMRRNGNGNGSHSP